MEGKHFKRDCKLVILNIFYTISFPFVRKDQAVIGTNILIDLQAYTRISGFIYVVTHLKMAIRLSMNTMESNTWFIIIFYTKSLLRCPGISRF